MSQPFSHYDARHYTALDVVSGYAEWSQSYDETMGHELDTDLLVRLDSVSWAQHKKAIDLGCGTGRMGVWLKAQGIEHLTGVDISPAMLGHATTKNVYNQLIQADITALSSLPGPYDLGLSILAACHVANLPAFFQQADQILSSSATFVIVDYHPFFLLKGIPTNFEVATGESIAIENHVHLFSDHVSAAHGSNWRLVEMVERLVDAPWITKAPSLAKHANQPIAFAMVWQRP